MTTLTRMIPAPAWLLEQTARWFEQITKFHKERYRRQYRWYDVESCGMW
jgi:hypothetical protein